MTDNQIASLTDKEHARFWAKVKQTDDPNACWLWQASKNVTGYGQYRFSGRARPAHRAAWIDTYGPIPLNLSVLHRCDVRACMNPSHLFLGTQLDNVRDMHEKGRGYHIPPRFGEANSKTTLAERDIRLMRHLAFQGIPTRRIAQTFGVCYSTAKRIIRNASWSHVDCHESDLRPKGRHGRPYPVMRGAASPSAKITESDVQTIRELARTGMTQTAIGRRFSISQGHVGKILLGQSWGHV